MQYFVFFPLVSLIGAKHTILFSSLLLFLTNTVIFAKLYNSQVIDLTKCMYCNN